MLKKDIKNENDLIIFYQNMNNKLLKEITKLHFYKVEFDKYFDICKNQINDIVDLQLQNESLEKTNSLYRFILICCLIIIFLNILFGVGLL